MAGSRLICAVFRIGKQVYVRSQNLIARIVDDYRSVHLCQLGQLGGSESGIAQFESPAAYLGHAGVETEDDERPIPLLDDSLNGMTERCPRSEAFENFVKSNGSGHRYQRLLRMSYLLSAIS